MISSHLDHRLSFSLSHSCCLASSLWVLSFTPSGVSPGCRTTWRPWFWISDYFIISHSTTTYLRLLVLPWIQKTPDSWYFWMCPFIAKLQKHTVIIMMTKCTWKTEIWISDLNAKVSPTRTKNDELLKFIQIHIIPHPGLKICYSQ